MKLYIVAYHNGKINAFTNPQYIDIEPVKAATQLKRSILNINKDDINKITVYRDLKMYYLGEFDDETAKFDLVEPELLLECTPIVDLVLEKYVPKEDLEDGDK